MFVCDMCSSVISGETTVGALIEEGDALRIESMRDAIKLMQALEKYNEAWNALSKSSASHAECIKSIKEDSKAVYRILQGSRA